ncbi:LOW QUALITY PROTEIN: hypothetical protein BU14_0058s0013 [Porphyra umbilicalis]|uniref:Uncharacterized protein n=1 Tax=Porphyra umbilicalis TaxID=2786 RepID=A0A1X6PGW1_PORUM|nr:LOW QUALITY PROTEIN: hypothetical protein BU14_0058s0013 [Porphyra umbilicalis]|eukprot:OSX80101.1 LOW QUALITY PROTEIN: hypothetical protein BU14_0058s0013 [Porphyra umbilicalis]
MQVGAEGGRAARRGGGAPVSNAGAVPGPSRPSHAVGATVATPASRDGAGACADSRGAAGASTGALAGTAGACATDVAAAVTAAASARADAETGGVPSHRGLCAPEVARLCRPGSAQKEDTGGGGGGGAGARAARHDRAAAIPAATAAAVRAATAVLSAAAVRAAAVDRAAAVVSPPPRRPPPPQPWPTGAAARSSPPGRPGTNGGWGEGRGRDGGGDGVSIGGGGDGGDGASIGGGVRVAFFATLFAAAGVARAVVATASAVASTAAIARVAARVARVVGDSGVRVDFSTRGVSGERVANWRQPAPQRPPRVGPVRKYSRICILQPTGWRWSKRREKGSTVTGDRWSGRGSGVCGWRGGGVGGISDGSRVGVTQRTRRGGPSSSPAHHITQTVRQRTTVHETPQPGTPATFDGWGKVVARDVWPGALPTEMWAAVASASVALSAVGDGPASATAVHWACGRRAGALTNRTETCRVAQCNDFPDRITPSSPTSRCKDPKSTHHLAHVAGVLMYMSTDICHCRKDPFARRSGREAYLLDEAENYACNCLQARRRQ